MKRAAPLKRTGFARRQYVAPPPAPVRPLDRVPNYSAANDAEPVPKMTYLRSEEYRRFVASHACFACGIAGWSQCAHPNQPKFGKGGHIKASDEFCFPLCSTRPGHVGCHVMHDLSLDSTRGERNEAEDRYVERMQALARAAGRKEFP